VITKLNFLEGLKVYLSKTKLMVEGEKAYSSSSSYPVLVFKVLRLSRNPG